MERPLRDPLECNESQRSVEFDRFGFGVGNDSDASRRLSLGLTPGQPVEWEGELEVPREGALPTDKMSGLTVTWERPQFPRRLRDPWAYRALQERDPRGGVGRTARRLRAPGC